VHFVETELTHSEDHRIVAVEGGTVAPENASDA
jgi:hypothetical protein